MCLMTSASYIESITVPVARDVNETAQLDVLKFINSRVIIVVLFFVFSRQTERRKDVSNCECTELFIATLRSRIRHAYDTTCQGSREHIVAASIRNLLHHEPGFC